MTVRIPCDTIARLAHLLPSEPSDDPMHCFRLDNGKVVTTNRQFMAVELVEPFDGVHYIRADQAMIEQCRTEAQWSGVIQFTPVEQMRWTTAVTTMGWKCSDNLGLWPTEPTDFDLWHERIVQPVCEPLTETKGPMVFDADGLALLARCSPSGKVVMEQFIDPRDRPTVVRDIDTADWTGFFNARITDGRAHDGAVVPGWLR